jgi:hypothetical protein
MKALQEIGSVVWKAIEGGGVSIVRLERCTRSLVQIVEKKTKFRSSRTDPDRCIAGTAIGIEDLGDTSRGMSRQAQGAKIP